MFRPTGGSVKMGPVDVMDYGRMSILADPTGAVFAIWKSPKKTRSPARAARALSAGKRAGGPLTGRKRRMKVTMSRELGLTVVLLAGALVLITALSL